MTLGSLYGTEATFGSHAERAVERNMQLYSVTSIQCERVRDSPSAARRVLVHDASMKKGCAITGGVLAGLLVVVGACGSYLLNRTETWEAELRFEVVGIHEDPGDKPYVRVEVVPGQDTGDALRDEQWMNGTASAENLGDVAEGDIVTCHVRQEYTVNTDFDSGASTDIERCRP